MKPVNKEELKEIVQSGHINFLIGSGCSLPYIPTLNGIEERMASDDTREAAHKEYYGLVRRSKSILDASCNSGTKKDRDALAKSKSNYDAFLDFWASIIARRSLHIVNKQVNIFTTNFDMFMEDSCERLGIPYNDGFSGQIKPRFDISHFNKVQKYKSLQFDNTSDIPLFNIIKLHGSASWHVVGDEIAYSDGSHVSDSLDDLAGGDFLSSYDAELALVNPNADKHLKMVLNVNYASMLRKFALELEKENSVLLVLGTSLPDEHIRNLLYGAMKSNPTLIVLYFAHTKYDIDVDDKSEKKNKNLYVVEECSFEGSVGYMAKAFPPDGIDLDSGGVTDAE